MLAPLPPGVAPVDHDLPVLGDGGGVVDLEEDGGQEGGGGELDDSAGEPLAVAEQGWVEHRLNPQLATRHSDTKNINHTKEFYYIKFCQILKNK